MADSIQVKSKAERMGGLSEQQRDCLGWNAAVNLITPMRCRRFTRWRRAAFMWWLQRAWMVNGARHLGLTSVQPVDESFKRLNHLHFARWSIVHRFPRPAGAQRETGRFTLLLFTSYFDFGWRNYLGIFIETTGNRLAKLWGDTPEWRYPSAGFRQFENFVVDQQVEHGHLFAAFPALAANDIHSAVRLHRDITAHHRTQDWLRSLGIEGEEQARARDWALLRRVQNCLGSLPSRVPIPPGAHVEVERARAQHGLTALLPFDHRRRVEMQNVLDRLPVGVEAMDDLPVGFPSPFAALPGTHYARLASIGNEYFERRSIPPLKNAYLLLSAEIDGSADDWLANLARVAELEAVWRICYGYTDPNSLPALVSLCRIKPSVEYIDYPGVTVEEIAEAMSVVNDERDMMLRRVTEQ